MLCKVDGCGQKAMYYGQCVCQKHYFRFMRTGSYELVKKANNTMPREWNGYIRIYVPEHPLADKNGYVAEHRMVVYDVIGESISECEMCGKSVDWSSVHIDHIDGNKKNNTKENLRPLCRVCNTFREYPEQHSISGHYKVTYEGVTKTPQEWARDPRVFVGGHVIRNRLKRGMSVDDALFSEKKTHNRIRKDALKSMKGNV